MIVIVIDVKISQGMVIFNEPWFPSLALKAHFCRKI